MIWDGPRQASARCDRLGYRHVTTPHKLQAEAVTPHAGSLGRGYAECAAPENGSAWQVGAAVRGHRGSQSRAGKLGPRCR